MIQSNPVFSSMDNPTYLNSIHHSGSARYVFLNAPHLGDEVTIRLRTNPKAPIQQVILRTSPDGEQHFTPLHLENHDLTGACD
jgi:hypothetical protein